jgi:hypothetical protein
MPDIASDAEFQRRNDARTLMEFVEIQKAPKRLAAAKKELKKMEAEAREASTVRKVAGKLRKL